MADRNSEIEAVVARIARREGQRAVPSPTIEPVAAALGDALLEVYDLDDAAVDRLTTGATRPSRPSRGAEADVVRAAMEAVERHNDG